MLLTREYVTLIDKFSKADEAPYPLSLCGECMSPAQRSTPVVRNAPKMRLISYPEWNSEESSPSSLLMIGIECCQRSISDPRFTMRHFPGHLGQQEEAACTPE
jgi:hypothetical protein